MLDKISTKPVGTKEINYYMIYDVKIDLTRKARLVAGRHLDNKVSDYMSFSSVVERDSVRIGLVTVAMNDSDIMAADVENSYLNAKPRKISHVKVGSDLFVIEYEGRYASIVRVCRHFRLQSLYFWHVCRMWFVYSVNGFLGFYVPITKKQKI